MATPSLATVGGLEFPLAYPGQIIYLGSDPDIITVTNENATAIDFGAPVSRGVGEAVGHQNGKPVAASTVVMGFAVRALSEANTVVQAGTVNYPQFSEVPIMKWGHLVVTAAENATVGDAAIIVAATPTTVGSATGGAANGTARLTAGATWQTTTTSGNLGIIRVDNGQ